MQSTAQALAEPFGQWESHCDYITAYWAEADSGRFPERQLLEAINGKIAEGHQPTTAAGNGITWHGAPGLNIGWRDGERFLRCSGPDADTIGWIHSETASSFSRADFALTGCARSARRGQARSLYEWARRLPRAYAQPQKCGLIEQNDGGETFTLGSRQSDVYLRVYDHGVAHDCAPSGHRWRYEAELKGDRATKAVALLRGSEQRQLAIAGLVRTLFTDRRIPMPVDIEAIESAMPTPTRSARMKRLEWMRSQVAPSVAKLIEEGQLEAVLEALGLAQYVQPKPQP